MNISAEIELGDIYAGEQQTYTVRLRNDDTKDPLDLTGLLDTSYVCFKVGTSTLQHLLSGSELEVSGSPFIGKLTGTISETQSAALPPGRVEVEVFVDSPTIGKKKVQVVTSHRVLSSFC